MDLTKYYQKIREEEHRIGDEFPIVSSEETVDGGRPGVRTEVPRRLAAKLIVEGLARLVDAGEATLFRADRAAAKEAADKAAAAARVSLAVLSQAELSKLRAKGPEE